MTSPFTIADAVLLAAVDYAAPAGRSATLREIVSAGDVLDHSVFSVPELCGGLGLLVGHGHVAVGEGRYAVTSPTAEAFARAHPRAYGARARCEAWIAFLEAQRTGPPGLGYGANPAWADWAERGPDPEAAASAIAAYVRRPLPGWSVVAALDRCARALGRVRRRGRG